MEKQSICHHHPLWFVIIFTIPSLVFLIFAFDSSALIGVTKGIISLRGGFSIPINTKVNNSLVLTNESFTSNTPLLDDSVNVKKTESNNKANDSIMLSNSPVLNDETVPVEKTEGSDSDNFCSGRYVYMHDLPSEFNVDVVANCSSLVKWFNICPYLTNMGFGPQVKSPNNDKSWYATNQFTLELIFHNRMKNYECLTNESSLASAIYVPFYAGFDIGRHLWGYDKSVRDFLGLALVKWLESQPEWGRMWGRDHFFVVGRISWDFHRSSDDIPDWGSRLFSLPEVMNMTILSIETTSWSNEFGVPYPTYFHPTKSSEILQWQKRMQKEKRPYLFSFTGAARPGLKDSVRGEVIKQCLSSKQCHFINCNRTDEGNRNKIKNCDDPAEVISVFRKSVFCLQPPGDSYTRRSIFDSILTGCIPVLFHPFSAYAQYTWFLPKNYKKYSVFISEKLMKEGKVDIEKTLLEIPKKKVMDMRKKVINLIPKISYADPRRIQLNTFEDAFDIAVKSVLKRIDNVRKLIEEGKDPGSDFAVENSWKQKLNGIGEVDEWDRFL